MKNPHRSADQDSLPGEVAAETTCDWGESGNTAVAIVEAVASVTGQEPTEMDPLSNVIDTDALEELFSSTRSTPRSTGHVQFQYQGCYVRVSATGEVRVSLPR